MNWSRTLAFTGAALTLSGGYAIAQIAPPPELAEIVVTAQKRSENVQDVPASISVVGTQEMDSFHMTQLTDIAAYVPGLQVDSLGTPGQALISMRGIAPF